MSDRSTTASSSSASTRANRKSGESSSPTAPRKSLSRGESSLLGMGRPTTMASEYRWRSRRGTRFCSASIQDRKSNSMVRNTSSCEKTKYWASSKAPLRRKRSRSRSHGKADYLRRALTPGRATRHQPAGRRGQGPARAQKPQSPDQKKIRPPNHHQGWRDGRQRNRPQGSAGKHGRADGARGREQDVGYRR